MLNDQKSFIIKSIAKELGFNYCGISKAEKLENEAFRLEKWLNKNYNGEMAYMANYFDKRIDPTLLVHGAKSVISLMMNYYPSEQQKDSDYKISKYAYGNDYHEVIRTLLNQFIERITEQFGSISARGFVDSAPVMDKAWAVKSGLGWVGKNSNVIHPKSGSFFFIAEIICDLELEADGPIKDYCGTCTRCIDACPTDAIVEPYVVDGSKCISYLTIELKNEIPNEFHNKMDNWIFGCDVCQDVCPWNRFSKQTHVKEFEINQAIKSFNNEEWDDLTEDAFKVIFKHSPLKRTKWKGINRNIRFIKPRHT